MPNEKTWPTQPFPTVIPPFNRQAVTVAELNPYYTASKRDSMITRLKAGKTGLFTPLSDKYETFAMPGSTGGANFGGTAANPQKGLVYVLTKEAASIYRLKIREPRPRQLSGDRLAQAEGHINKAARLAMERIGLDCLSWFQSLRFGIQSKCFRF